MSTRLRSQNRLSAAVITMRNNRTVHNRFVRHVRQSALFSQVPLLLRASPFFFFFVAFFFIHTILRRFITRRWMGRWKFFRKCRQIRRCTIGRSLFSCERLQRRIAMIKPILRKSLSSRLDFYSKEFESAKMREMQRIIRRYRKLYFVQLYY